MAVPGHESPEAQVVIDIFVSVDVVNPAALALLHENRMRFVGSVIAGNAEWYALQRAPVRFSGFPRAHFVGGNFFLQCVVHFSAPYEPTASATTRTRPVPCSQYRSNHPLSVRRRSSQSRA